MKPETLILTKEMIERGISSRGGYNKQQLATIGVDWPPVKGWKMELIGTTVTKEQYEEFIRLANTKR